MSDTQSAARLSADAELAAALHGLPLAAPAPGVWPELEAALRAQGLVATAPRQRRWMLAVPAALAAALVLAVMLSRVPTPVPGTAPAPIAAERTDVAAPDAAPTAELEALRHQSQRLESWLAQLTQGATPLDGADLMAAAETEDLIGLVDVQLAAAGARPDAAALWRQRIALLEDLAALRTGAASADTSRFAQGGGPTAAPTLQLH